jgi:hypothetical protein
VVLGELTVAERLSGTFYIVTAGQHLRRRWCQPPRCNWRLDGRGNCDLLGCAGHSSFCSRQRRAGLVQTRRIKPLSECAARAAAHLAAVSPFAANMLGVRLEHLDRYVDD